MLGHRRNDWNMDFGISGIPERVEASTPGSNESSIGQSNNSDEHDASSDDTRDQEEVTELLLAQEPLQILQKCNSVQESENTCKKAFFTGLDIVK